MSKGKTAVDRWERIAQNCGERIAKQIEAVAELVGDRPAWSQKKTPEQLFEDYIQLDQGGPDAWSQWISDRMQLDGMDPESAVNEAIKYDIKMRKWGATHGAPVDNTLPAVAPLQPQQGDQFLGSAPPPFPMR